MWLVSCWLSPWDINYPCAVQCFHVTRAEELIQWMIIWSTKKTVNDTLLMVVDASWSLLVLWWCIFSDTEIQQQCWEGGPSVCAVWLLCWILLYSNQNGNYVQLRYINTICDSLSHRYYRVFAGHLSRWKRQINEATPTYPAPQKVDEKKRL